MFFFAIFGIQVISNALTDVVQVKLREHTFLIPKHNAMERESVIPFWLLNMKGLDDGSSSVLYHFDDMEVKTAIPDYQVSNYNQYKDDIGGMITAFTPQEVSNFKNPGIHSMLGDLWRATGSYKDRIVEPDEIPGWYKVYRKVEYKRTWAVLSRFPDSEKPMPAERTDFWIAHCLLLGPKGPKGKQDANCRVRVLVDDIYISINISDYNLPLLDELKAFITGKVQEWKQEPSN